MGAPRFAMWLQFGAGEERVGFFVRRDKRVEVSTRLVVRVDAVGFSGSFRQPYPVQVALAEKVPLASIHTASLLDPFALTVGHDWTPIQLVVGLYYAMERECSGTL